MIHMPVRAPTAVAVPPRDVSKLSGFATILGSVGEPPPRLAPTRSAAEPLPRFLNDDARDRTVKEKEKDEARSSNNRPRPRSFRQLAAASEAVDLDQPGNATMLFGWLGESLESLGALDALDGAALEPIDTMSAPSGMPDGLADDLAALDVNISVSAMEPKSAAPSLGNGTSLTGDDAAVFEFPKPASKPAVPHHRAPLGAPLPADPIRDDGLLFEFPRPLAPSAPAPGTLGLPSLPGVHPSVPGRPGTPGVSTGLPASDEEGGETSSTFGALLGVGAAAPVATGDPRMTPLTASTAVNTGADAPSEAAARAEAASLQQDAHTAIGNAITVRLDDALGHWEVDVIRRDHLLDLVLRGDASLHDAVRDSTPELRERLAQDGVTLNRVAYSDPQRNTHMRQEGTSNHDARREEAPPWPRSVAPRTRATTVPNLASAAFVRRGALDRAV